MEFLQNSKIFLDRKKTGGFNRVVILWIHPFVSGENVDFLIQSISVAKYGHFLILKVH